MSENKQLVVSLKQEKFGDDGGTRHQDEHHRVLRKEFLTEMANNVGFDDFSPVFSEEIYKQQKDNVDNFRYKAWNKFLYSLKTDIGFKKWDHPIFTSDVYENLKMIPTKEVSRSTTRSVKMTPSVQTPPSDATPSQLLNILRSSFQAEKIDPCLEQSPLSSQEVIGPLFGKEYNIVQVPDFTTNTPSANSKSSTTIQHTTQLYAVECAQSKDKSVDSLVLSVARATRYSSASELNTKLISTLQKNLTQFYHNKTHKLDEFQLAPPLVGESCDLFIHRFMSSLISNTDLSLVLIRLTILSHLTKTSIRLFLSDLETSAVSNECITIGHDSYSYGVAILRCVKNIDGVCSYKLLLNYNQHESHIASKSNTKCQCTAYCHGKPLGKGMGGIVYNFGDTMVIKKFHNIDGYKQEKLIHMETAQRITNSPFLQQSLCLATNFCDKHATLILPKLDPNGRDLEEILSCNDILRLSDCSKLFIKLEKIVNGCHLHDILHNDLKAKNIYVLPTGDLILFDFGLSLIITDVQRDEQIEMDAKQLLWICLQLRFHLPFQYLGTVNGLMVEDPKITDPLLRWDLSPVIYGLAGLSFDALTYATLATPSTEPPRTCFYTTAAVHIVFEELFASHDLPNFDSFPLYPLTTSQWSTLTALCELLDRHHRSIKWCAEADGDYSPLRQIKDISDQILAYHTISFRLLFSIAPSEFDAHANTLSNTINERYTAARRIIADLRKQIKKMQEERDKWAWCRFIPVIGPIIKATLQLLTGDFHGLFRSLKDILLSTPIGQAVSSAISAVKVVFLFATNQASKAVNQLLDMGRSLTVSALGKITGGVGGVMGGLLYDAASGGVMSAFDGEFRWMGNLAHVKAITDRNGESFGDLAVGVFNDAKAGHSSEKASQGKAAAQRVADERIALAQRQQQQQLKVKAAKLPLTNNTKPSTVSDTHNVTTPLERFHSCESDDSFVSCKSTVTTNSADIGDQKRIITLTTNQTLYHGTDGAYLMNIDTRLKTGRDERGATAGSGHQHGPGFYVTQNHAVAMGYANYHRDNQPLILGLRPKRDVLATDVSSSGAHHTRLSNPIVCQDGTTVAHHDDGTTSTGFNQVRISYATLKDDFKIYCIENVPQRK